jgi:hypothetical protein
MAPRKRKASNELSTNPNTKKVRDREAKMTEIELQIEKAKKADIAAVGYALKKLKGTVEWENLDPAEQAKMKIASGEKVIHKR